MKVKKEKEDFMKKLKNKINSYKKKLRYNAITHKTPYRNKKNTK